jgi:hypothetical protein
MLGLGVPQASRLRCAKIRLFKRIQGRLLKAV